jgi:nicotinate-nucleotide adenylyltransferase
MTFGVFGGSFDPPHVGHVMAAAYAMSIGNLDQIIVVPTFQHPFEKNLAHFEHRLEMCMLAFDPIQNVKITAIEESLPTPSYMINTLEELFDEACAASVNEIEEMRLVIGNDCLGEKDKWKDWDKIEELAPPFVIPRHVDKEEYNYLPDVSSSMIRSMCELSRWDEIYQRVPISVVDYIRVHKLYEKHDDKSRNTKTSQENTRVRT